jgi:transcriptional regulator with XRE-family HTH domain
VKSVGKQAICARIRALAAEKKLSNIELARAADVSYHLVYNVMRGTANLRDKTIGKFAEALGSSVAFLMEGTSPSVVREPAVEYVTKEVGTLKAAIRTICEQLGISEAEAWERLLPRQQSGKRKESEV